MESGSGEAKELGTDFSSDAGEPQAEVQGLPGEKGSKSKDIDLSKQGLQPRILISPVGWVIIHILLTFHIKYLLFSEK